VARTPAPARWIGPKAGSKHHVVTDASQGDLAYDSEPHRQGLKESGVEPVLPEREIDEQEGLGETRGPVERTLAWTHQNRRLRIRYERRLDIHQAFLTLAMIKICASALFLGSVRRSKHCSLCFSHIISCINDNSTVSERQMAYHGQSALRQDGLHPAVIAGGGLAYSWHRVDKQGDAQDPQDPRKTEVGQGIGG
jgi:transposase